MRHDDVCEIARRRRVPVFKGFIKPRGVVMMVMRVCMTKSDQNLVVMRNRKGLLLIRGCRRERSFLSLHWGM